MLAPGSYELVKAHRAGHVGDAVAGRSLTVGPVRSDSLKKEKPRCTQSAGVQFPMEEYIEAYRHGAGGLRETPCIMTCWPICFSPPGYNSPWRKLVKAEPCMPHIPISPPGGASGFWLECTVTPDPGQQGCMVQALGHMSRSC